MVGRVLSSLCTVGVDLLEKESSEDCYILAVQLLRLLLSCGYHSHKRRKWLERLCIDLKHLGREEDALEAVLAGRKEAEATGQVSAFMFLYLKNYV